MNGQQMRLNDHGIGELPPDTYERPGDELIAVGASHSRKSRWRLTIMIVLLFWLFWYLVQSAYMVANDPAEVLKYAPPRTGVAAAGVAISLVIAAILDRLKNSRLSFRAFVATFLAFAATVLHAVITRHIWAGFVSMDTDATSSTLAIYTTDFVLRCWFFASQTAIILALSYAADVREREDRIQTLQRLAHAAQLRALRNQLNPHFIFNALNSIAGLISLRRVDEAEVMTVNLADFLRTTLALDPQQLITLEEEIELQTLYLDVEKQRFPERLQIEIDIPPDLQKALVPGLITQPLVENSIKYAVARSSEPVHVRIAASAQDSRLKLIVEDCGGNANSPGCKSTRTGLSNVANRLSAHFGELAQFEATQTKSGFRNTITIPLRVA
jgi:two-component system LytT family sensor kinase